MSRALSAEASTPGTHSPLVPRGELRLQEGTAMRVGPGVQGRNSGCGRSARLLPFLQREGGTSGRPVTGPSLNSLRKTGSEARGKPVGRLWLPFLGLCPPLASGVTRDCYPKHLALMPVYRLAIGNRHPTLAWDPRKELFSHLLVHQKFNEKQETSCLLIE